jgi:hypothetical protein
MKQRRRGHDGNLCNCLTPPIWITQSSGRGWLSRSVPRRFSVSRQQRIVARGKTGSQLSIVLQVVGRLGQPENPH